MLSLITSKAFDEAYDFFSKKIKYNFKGVKITKLQLESALKNHLNYVDLATREMFFKETAYSGSITKMYINLDINLTPKKYGNQENKIKPKKILEIIKQDNHIILLGDPGAGKTTTLHKLCQLILYNNIKQLEPYNFPILISLRSLDENETIYDKLINILGINIYWGEKELYVSSANDKETYRILKNVINEYLNHLKVLLLIDGFDEVHPRRFKNDINELRELTTNLRYSKVIASIRSGAYNIILENTNEFEIAPFTKKQKETFCNNWFNDKGKSKKFLYELSSSPLNDTSDRPLILAFLCSLYNKFFEIPKQPHFVYQKIIRLLIEDWDSKRELRRISKYKSIDSDKIFSFLMQFAFELTINYDYKEYSYNDIKYIFKELISNYEIDINEIESFLFDIETRNGIFVKSSFNKYEFSHKSIQEYLTAEYISKLPEIPEDLIFQYNLFNELAIAVALSSNQTLYFCNLVLNKLSLKVISDYDTYIDENYEDYISIFFRRLLVERVEFSKSSVLAYSFIYMFHLWFLDNPRYPEEYFDEECVKSNKYIEIISPFLKLRNIQESFKLLADDIVFSEAFYDISKYNFNHCGFVELSIDKSIYLKNLNFAVSDKIYISKELFQLCFPIDTIEN